LKTLTFAMKTSVVHELTILCRHCLNASIGSS
jgi:hypothetical protein